MDFRVEQHVDALQDAAVYPRGAGGPVTIVQTHVSVVALVGDRAYKLKKAVRLPFVDFSSLAQREVACRDELRLNRRLAPDVYLAVLPLRRTPAGLRLGSDDRTAPIVDWAVAMRRLPAERMLDRLLAERAVEPAAIRDLARRIATFHGRAAADADADVRALGAPERLIEQIGANFRDAERFGARGDDASLDRELLLAVRDRVEPALPQLAKLLRHRLAAGRVVEGHGDLHARNVCMTVPPTIYDCVEFRRDFRCGDVATDLAFLAMDLRLRGCHHLVAPLVDAYVAASGDPDLPAVLPELVRYRAMVRAKVDALGATDPAIPPAVRARLRGVARKHLRLCAWTLVEAGARVVILGSGLPASGKSTLLRTLRVATGWPVFESDAVRKELFGVAPQVRLPQPAYSPAASDRVYGELTARALAGPGPAIVDANYREAVRRRQACAAVRAAGAVPVVVRVELAEPVALERLRRRSAANTSVSDADERVYARLLAQDEPPEPSEGAAAIVRLDGAASRAHNLDRLAVGLLRATARC
ncbi:MAG: AAA family ATPase [Planctomycetes bacterium]|nr:AAA family ATPase [Planctomycetota bacterium]